MAVPSDFGVLLLATAASAGAIGLAVLAAALLARSAEERDLGGRLKGLARPVDRAAGDEARASIGLAVLRPILRLDELLRDSAFTSAKDLAEFQMAVAAAGLNPRQAVPVLLGAKAALVVLLPLLAITLAWMHDYDLPQAGLLLAGALVLSVTGPNWIVTRLQRPFQKQLRRGLPDAIDLMVVAAEAGLGLESALERVAREMERSNRAIAVELNVLVQEMRMLPDRRLALQRMADRTGVDGFKQLAGTLSQTLRYGTPLTQALRVLAAEMRADRQLRLEEKAIRLPALLIGPLILFILPALFIALIGPSVLEMGRTFGGP